MDSKWGYFWWNLSPKIQREPVRGSTSAAWDFPAVPMVRVCDLFEDERGLYDKARKWKREVRVGRGQMMVMQEKRDSLCSKICGEGGGGEGAEEGEERNSAGLPTGAVASSLLWWFGLALMSTLSSSGPISARTGSTHRFRDGLLRSSQ